MTPTPEGDPTSFDLSTTYVHLGLGGRAELLTDFEWSQDYLNRYEREHQGDGPDGRLVMISSQDETWTSWERHPSGEELVICLSGHQTLIQELDGGLNPVELRAGQAVINPQGVWHTADVHEPGLALFITSALGTHHRPR